MLVGVDGIGNKLEGRDDGLGAMRLGKGSERPAGKMLFSGPRHTRLWCNMNVHFRIRSI